MMEAPKRIWISVPYGAHAEDWDFADESIQDEEDLRELGRLAYVPEEEVLYLRTQLAEAEARGRNEGLEEVYKLAVEASAQQERVFGYQTVDEVEELPGRIRSLITNNLESKEG